MGNLVEKQTIAQFVHDAVEMEAAVFTLDRMEEECRKKKEDILSTAKKIYMDAENELNKHKADVGYAKNKYNIESGSPVKKKFIHLKSFLWFSAISYFPIVIISFFIVGILIGIIIMLNGGVLDEEIHGKGIAIASYIFGTLLTIVCGYLVSLIYVNRDYKILLVEKEKKVSLAKEQYENAKYRYEVVQGSFDNKLADYSQKKNIANSIDSQIQDIINKRSQIQNNLKSFYNYGIIPPDQKYRNFDCVLILDEIFKNDLADTMREALRIYDERVFRGSVIREMNKIGSMLGKLSSDMSAISLRLDMINNNVAHMSNDLYNYNQRLVTESAKNRAATEDLIRETQLGRYTNEKLLESNKRLEYYAEEYRMGRMPRDFMN